MRLISGPENGQCIRFATAFATVIVSWAVLHDNHLIRVEPRHFTEFHRTLLPLSDLTLLATQYAVVATLGPGLLFGFLAWVAARWGDRPKKKLGGVLGGFLALLLVIEAILLGLGAYAEARYDRSGATLYPPSFYPEETRGIIYTQTINISAYLIAPATGFAYLLLIFRSRQRKPLLQNFPGES